VLLVSHDRALLDAVGTRTVAIQDGTLRSYQGGWADYAATRTPPPAPPKPKKDKPRRPPDHAQREARLERDIEAAEAALAAVEDELADPAAWSDPERAAAAARRHEEARAAVEALYAELEALGSGGR
jgi:ATP-binding cassette subfamily F protein 3